MKRWLRPLLPLPLLLALAAGASARAADRAAQVGATVLAMIAPFARDTSPPDDEPAVVAIPTETAPVADVLGGSAAPAPHGTKHPRPAKARPSTPAVLFVSQEEVLRLASSRARPRGTPVPASGPRPAGLKLSGVAALGIGLQDGDVLTRALGQPALSSGAVIQAVLSARARRDRILEGEFWRGNQRWVLRVEQPYLPERRALQAPGGPTDSAVAADDPA